jgi:hypothetical protein
MPSGTVHADSLPSVLPVQKSCPSGISLPAQKVMSQTKGCKGPEPRTHTHYGLEVSAGGQGVSLARSRLAVARRHLPQPLASRQQRRRRPPCCGEQCPEGSEGLPEASSPTASTLTGAC